ncbi:unnamed protein product [Blumeria hordei]|uniref:Membrane fusion mating protein FIG1 n=2 Tax=Blumeria hordei TaxID=2867405 RepID=A0A383UWS4_BLUHO|nr:unnamed protein product [Blumeria hordei]
MSDEHEAATFRQRALASISFHHLLMVMVVIAMILLSLLLAGCSSSSPLIPGIFLISLYYQKYVPVPSTAQVDYNAHNAIAVVAGEAVLQCRVGYFGICINPDGGSWLCSNNATALANEIALSQDPLNLVWLASQFKDMIVFPYLLIIAVLFAFLCLLILATFPNWENEGEGEDLHLVKRFPTRSVAQISLISIFISCAFVLVSVLWQHTASVAASIIVQDFGNGSVRSGVGTSAMVLGWFGLVFLVTIMIGLLFFCLTQLSVKQTEE